MERTRSKGKDKENTLERSGSLGNIVLRLMSHYLRRPFPPTPYLPKDTVSPPPISPVPNVFDPHDPSLHTQVLTVSPSTSLPVPIWTVPELTVRLPVSQTGLLVPYQNQSPSYPRLKSI